MATNIISEAFEITSFYSSNIKIFPEIINFLCTSHFINHNNMNTFNSWFSVLDVKATAQTERQTAKFKQKFSA
jgi:hypothetical protein